MAGVPKHHVATADGLPANKTVQPRFVRGAGGNYAVVVLRVALGAHDHTSPRGKGQSGDSRATPSLGPGAIT
jgi:hypothetical protein